MVSVDFGAILQFAGVYGLPATILIVVIVVMVRGDVVFKREVAREQEATAREREIAIEIAKSRDKWEGIAWEGIRTANVAVSTQVPVKEQPP